MEKKISIALDGPAAAGKSTVAKKVAKILNITYVDTGAMYRSVTLFALMNNVDPKNEKEVCMLIPKIEINMDENDNIFLNHQNVTKEIRSREVAENVSYIASYKDVRIFLVDQQRKIASASSVIMDGRDIGSYVLPNADVKIYQIASVSKRARRRYEENISKNISCTYDDIHNEILKRDYIDSHRDFSPLKKADDAVVLDTSNLTVNEVVQEVLKIIKEKLGE